MRCGRLGHWSWLACLLATPIIASAQSIPAFPGADGPGSDATGGRGGDVYHVTSLGFDLNGTIPGTLKYGIVTAPVGGRTIVFDVGGTVFQNGGGSQYWFRSGTSNITIAGQTAPGGVTIAGVGSKFTGDNIILRNITIRPNVDPVNPTGYTYDGLGTQATNSIIDHVTVTWFTDEGVSATDAVNNTTVQYALIGEGLNYNGHSYGSIINTENSGAPIGYHHNLYAHNNSRNPRLGSETGTGAVTNFYNNVIYNWVNRAGYSALNVDTGAQEPSRTNFLGNYYVRGNNNGSTIFNSAGDQTQIYQSGNVYDGNKNGQFDGTTVTWSQFAGGETQLSDALPVADGAIDTADAGRDHVLDYSGARWWDRNAIEARIVDSVRHGTGSIINYAPAGEWDSVVNATMTSRAADWDTDGDGMPNYWEVEYGLDPDVANNNADFDSDGYTDLEEYLNETAAWPAPGEIVFNGTGSRYAEILNWQVSGQQVNISGQGTVTTKSYWQPSRFDTAVVNSGTVVVDAVGQHAGTLRLGSNPGDNATLNITGGWLKVEDTGAVVIGSDAAATAVLNLSGGELSATLLTKGAGGTFNFTGGKLHAGEVAFDLVNNGGTLSPGTSTGQTVISGDYDQLAPSTLEIEITSLTDFDFVSVMGTADLAGLVNVVLDPGFTLGEDDSFQILVAGALVDSGIALATGGDNDLFRLDVDTGTGVVTLLAASAGLPGDYNGDGTVDAADYTVWRDTLGSTTDLRANGDDTGASQGVVDEADFAVWKANFGMTAGSGQSLSANVPEPLSLGLWVLGILGQLCWRRRKA